MKHSILKWGTRIGYAVLFSVLVFACDDSDENVATTGDQTSVDSKNSVAVTSTTQEVISVTSDAMDSNGVTSGGRSASGRTSGTNACEASVKIDYSVNTTNEDSLVHQGTITIDYGDGTSCSSSHVRKGKIADNFNTVGLWKNDDLTITTDETITLTGYYRDSVSVDGVITSNSKSGESSYDVEAKNVKITYSDGSTLSYSGTYTYEDQDYSTEMTGTWSGLNRKGSEFTAKTTAKVVYKYSCKNSDTLEAVSGTIEEKTGDQVSIVDYGDGTCDNEYTITTDGKTVKYTFD